MREAAPLPGGLGGAHVILSEAPVRLRREESRRLGHHASYYVYVMANRSKTLYVGVTNNLERRVYEYKHGMMEGFTSRYKLTKLVYHETTQDAESAIKREKQIKGWLRSKKVSLIEQMNPEWDDLSDSWQMGQ